MLYSQDWEACPFSSVSVTRLEAPVIVFPLQHTRAIEPGSEGQHLVVRRTEVGEPG